MSDTFRLVVTGTKGQLVSALHVRAAAIGVDVVAVGRPDVDLLNPGRIASVLDRVKADVIVNAAAYTAVDMAEAETDLAMAVNAEAAGAVARAAARCGVPVIQLSTDYVFEGWLGRPYREDDPAWPTTAYGRSKLAGELAVIAAAPAHIVLRTAWLYSPFGTNFVKTMLRLGETCESVRVVADQRGNPTSAFSIADAVIAVARNLHAHPERHELLGLFHVVDGGEATWADFAEATQGLLLCAIVHAADIQDRDGGVMLMGALFGLFPFLLKLYADSGYQGPKFQQGLKRVCGQINVEIVKRCDVGKFVVLPKRWIVERTIAWLNRCRRLAKDWECLSRNGLAFLRWASIRMIVRKLCQNNI